MFYEFALDPSLVATWHDRKKFFFFDEKFNLRQRRILRDGQKKFGRHSMKVQMLRIRTLK